MVQDWFGLGSDDPQTAGVIYTKGTERVYLVLDGAALIEPRRAPGHFQGGSQGVSLHVAKGVNYRVGAIRGRYVPGPESPTPIDVGRAVITDQRVTFAGQRASREWLFSKLIGCQHDPDNWTVLAVSNRQKASGIGYDSEHAPDVIFRLDLAIATATSRRPSMLQQLQAQRATLPSQARFARAVHRSSDRVVVRANGRTVTAAVTTGRVVSGLLRNNPPAILGWRVLDGTHSPALGPSVHECLAWLRLSHPVRVGVVATAHIAVAVRIPAGLAVAAFWGKTHHPGCNARLTS